jgi:polyribonucleotide 5'-hydroxyl-kinase
VGKSSLAKVLLNYAIKQGRTPIFVDLDTNEGSVSVPGSIGALMMCRPISVEEEFSSALLSLQSTPLVHYYGYDSPLEFPKLYKRSVAALACNVMKKLEGGSAKNSGLIVNAPCQLAETTGFEILKDAIASLGINVVLVLGHERLYAELSKAYSSTTGTNKQMDIIKVPKSGGVSSRDKGFRKQLSMVRVKEYFYGAPGRSDLSPFSVTISFNDILVRVVGEGESCS